jgi:hypothetical protein
LGYQSVNGRCNEPFPAHVQDGFCDGRLAEAGRTFENEKVFAAVEGSTDAFYGFQLTFARSQR